MPLEQTLKKRGRKPVLRSVEQRGAGQTGVILPVLRALGWDDADPEAFKPEFSVDCGLVDYALLYRGRPLVFIEAKLTGGRRNDLEWDLRKRWVAMK